MGIIRREKFDPLDEGQLIDELETGIEKSENDLRELEEARAAGYSSVETYRAIEGLVKEIDKVRFALAEGESSAKYQEAQTRVDETITGLRSAFGNVTSAEVYPQDSDPEDERELKWKLERDERDKERAARGNYPSVETLRALDEVRYNIRYDTVGGRHYAYRLGRKDTRTQATKEIDKFREDYLPKWLKGQGYEKV
ncbi:MAG: hypothetical protein Q8P99_00215 [bacterium]|nr:hypothetical protein [bacterium]